jgi:SAM-dependent methyltransferase
VEDEAARQKAALKQFVASGQYLQRLYGLEWGDPRQSPALLEVCNRFVLPYAMPDSTVVEIGAGGGRWSREFIGRVRRLILVDGVPEFEIALRHQFDCSRVEFVASPDGRLPSVPDRSVDFVFSFDTFVHFAADLFDRYVESVGRVLRPGGHFALHHARFYETCAFNPHCFQYRGDEEIARLLQRQQLSLVEHLPLPVGYGSRMVLARKDLPAR